MAYIPGTASLIYDDAENRSLLSVNPVSISLFVRSSCSMGRVVRYLYPEQVSLSSGSQSWRFALSGCRRLYQKEIGVIVFCAFRRLDTLMKPLLLLIAASLRSQVRVVKSHLYSWLILTPMVIGITYLSVSRLTEEVSLQRLSFPGVWVLGTLLCLSLIGFTLSRAVTELYHLRRPRLSRLPSLRPCCSTQGLAPWRGGGRAGRTSHAGRL